MRSVIVLNGPVGVGNTALGRALARDLGGAFIDSDDFRDPSERWIDQVPSLTSPLARAGTDVLASRPVLVVAMRHAPSRARLDAPPREVSRRRGGRLLRHPGGGRGRHPDPARGLAFGAAGRDRVTAMIAQGYAPRPFSDLVVRTGRADLAGTLSRLREGCRPLLRRTSP